MSDKEIADRTSMSIEKARLANQRLASEPIVWQDDPDRYDQFFEKIEKKKLRVVKGGRFYHIMGNTDKAQAVSELTQAYKRYYGVGIHSIVLGDSENDLDMLQVASTAVVIPKEDGTHMQLKEKEKVIYASKPGAAGWGEVVEELV
jgi:mannosyl-3-phosphoglycerate phosphatase